MERYRARTSIASFLLALVAACTQDAPETLSPVADWPALPSGVSLGQSVGVDVDSHNHVFVFHRAERQWIEPFPANPIATATIFMLDGDSGALLASWGEGRFIMPHGLSIDPDDNVWVTDVGTHQVHKFSHEGDLLASLGEEGVAGDDATHFDQPTDVAFGRDGTLYISDGYRNTRIARFSPDGTYLGQWGLPGTAPGEFNVPHAIAIDDSNRVYVADRENARVQIFDADGAFLTEWDEELVGRPYGVDVAANGDVYIIDGGDQPDQTRARIFRLTRDGRVEAEVDTRSADDANVLGHDIAVGRDGAVYVGDIRADRVRKLVSD